MAKIKIWNWSFSPENGRKSKILWMKYPLNIFFRIYQHEIVKFYSKCCENPIIMDKISLFQISAKIWCWTWSFSTENGRKSKILRMKHPLKIFLHNIASWYRQVSTQKVAKILLLWTKIHYTQIFENKVLKMKF